MSLNLNCVTGHNDHLYKRIQQSIHTATSIDIIVSFLMESGVKLIQKDLEEIKDKNIPIRILTGNYLNITQPSALYLLKDILGDKVDLRFYNDIKRSFHGHGLMRPAGLAGGARGGIRPRPATIERPHVEGCYLR